MLMKIIEWEKIEVKQKFSLLSSLNARASCSFFSLIFPACVRMCYFIRPFKVDLVSFFLLNSEQMAYKNYALFKG